MQCLHLLRIEVTSVAAALQRKKQVSVDDMIVITHNLASLLITDRRQVNKQRQAGEDLEVL